MILKTSQVTCSCGAILYWDEVCQICAAFNRMKKLHRNRLKKGWWMEKTIKGDL